jgi:predicted metal-dependent HD superfamily phosphohydrolase
MFATAQRLGIKLTVSQSLAIWWHDAVYIPGSPNNEADSVSLMCQTIPRADNVILREAANMIQDTAKHFPHGAKSAIVCDLDMFILAESDTVHDEYKRNLRLEYSNMSDIDYCLGRVGFLGNMLDGAIIFHSPQFKQYTERAVMLAAQELDELNLILRP